MPPPPDDPPDPPSPSRIPPPAPTRSTFSLPSHFNTSASSSSRLPTTINPQDIALPASRAATPSPAPPSPGMPLSNATNPGPEPSSSAGNQEGPASSSRPSSSSSFRFNFPINATTVEDAPENEAMQVNIGEMISAQQGGRGEQPQRPFAGPSRTSDASGSSRYASARAHAQALASSPSPSQRPTASSSSNPPPSNSAPSPLPAPTANGQQPPRPPFSFEFALPSWLMSSNNPTGPHAGSNSRSTNPAAAGPSSTSTSNSTAGSSSSPANQAHGPASSPFGPFPAPFQTPWMEGEGSRIGGSGSGNPPSTNSASASGPAPAPASPAANVNQNQPGAFGFPPMGGIDLGQITMVFDLGPIQFGNALGPLPANGEAAQQPGSPAGAAGGGQAGQGGQGIANGLTEALLRSVLGPLAGPLAAGQGAGGVSGAASTPGGQGGAEAAGPAGAPGPAAAENGAQPAPQPAGPPGLPPWFVLQRPPGADGQAQGQGLGDGAGAGAGMFGLPAGGLAWTFAPGAGGGGGGGGGGGAGLPAGGITGGAFFQQLQQFLQQSNAVPPDPERAQELLRGLKDPGRDTMFRLDRVVRAENAGDKIPYLENGEMDPEIEGWKCAICMDSDFVPHDEKAVAEDTEMVAAEDTPQASSSSSSGVASIPSSIYNTPAGSSSMSIDRMERTNSIDSNNSLALTDDNEMHDVEHLIDAGKEARPLKPMPHGHRHSHVRLSREEMNRTNVKVFPCNHVFHENCLEPWFRTKTTCPTCRFDIDPLSTTLRQPATAPRFRPAPTQNTANENRHSPYTGRRGLPGSGRSTPVGGQPAEVQEAPQGAAPPAGNNVPDGGNPQPGPLSEMEEAVNRLLHHIIASRVAHLQANRPAATGAANPPAASSADGQPAAAAPQATVPQGGHAQQPGQRRQPGLRAVVEFVEYVVATGPDGRPIHMPAAGQQPQGPANAQEGQQNPTEGGQENLQGGISFTRAIQERMNRIRERQAALADAQRADGQGQASPPTDQAAAGPSAPSVQVAGQGPSHQPASFEAHAQGLPPNPGSPVTAGNPPPPGAPRVAPQVPPPFPFAPAVFRGPPPRPSHQPRKSWHAPKAQQTLEEWVTSREVAMHWRCDDTICLHAPLDRLDDEDGPKPAQPWQPTNEKTVRIWWNPPGEEDGFDGMPDYLCPHQFHPSCLKMSCVSNGWWHRYPNSEQVWVRCPRCRKQGWVKNSDVVYEQEEAAAMDVDATSSAR